MAPVSLFLADEEGDEPEDETNRLFRIDDADFPPVLTALPPSKEDVARTRILRFNVPPDDSEEGDWIGRILPPVDLYLLVDDVARDDNASDRDFEVEDDTDDFVLDFNDLDLSEALAISASASDEEEVSSESKDFLLFRSRFDRRRLFDIVEFVVSDSSSVSSCSVN